MSPLDSFFLIMGRLRMPIICVYQSLVQRVLDRAKSRLERLKYCLFSVLLSVFPFPAGQTHIYILRKFALPYRHTSCGSREYSES